MISKKKSYIPILTATVIITLAAAWWLFSTAKTPLKPYLTINDVAVSLEIADTPAEQARGLSGHQPLARDQGMLFVFPDQQVRQFWMKEMLYPLDIIWIRDDRVVSVSKNLPPEGANPAKLYSSESPVNCVLEVNAGWAERHQLQAGDLITYHL